MISKPSAVFSRWAVWQVAQVAPMSFIAAWMPSVLERSALTYRSAAALPPVSASLIASAAPFAFHYFSVTANASLEACACCLPRA